ncbi:hypothetical protein GYB59_21310 [bacterium]|nr:hypothetical protein [bacterium]
MLMLEKALLIEVARCVDERFAREDEAEADFIASVRAYLNNKAFGRTWHAEPFVPGRPPRFLLQIGIQIYAASKMAADPAGDFTDRAYHPHLDELIGDKHGKHRFNLNKQTDYHQELWRVRLKGWSDHKGLELDLPEDHGVNRNHISLPLSQMVLRDSDIQRLPVFFCKANLESRNSKRDELLDVRTLGRISSELSLRKDDSECFEKWARSVLNDDVKFKTAVRQVAEAYRKWDGLLELPASRLRNEAGVKRSTCYWLSISPSRYGLRVFRGHSLETAEKVSQQDDIVRLFAGEIRVAPGLAMHNGIGLFRYEEDDAAFKATPYLESGDRGLVVISSHFSGDRQKLLSEGTLLQDVHFYSSEETELNEKLDGIPSSCLLLTFQIVDPLPPIEDISELWRPFLRLQPPGFSLAGGLRLGRKETFVAGAGPTLKITGKVLPRFITVDGDQVLVTSRTVELDQFSDPGRHLIGAKIDGKQISKRFKVVNPPNAVPLGMPKRGWRITAGKWPKWFSESEAPKDTTETIQKVGVEPSIFGVINQGLHSGSTGSVSAESETLAAIRLLAGIPSFTDVDNECSHPLVRHLLSKRRQHDPDEREI